MHVHCTRQKLATLPSQPAVEIDGNYIERVKNFKCLGLNVDETLTWDAHIATITSKVVKVIGVLRKLKSLLPHHVLVITGKIERLPYHGNISKIFQNLVGNNISMILHTSIVHKLSSIIWKFSRNLLELFRQCRRIMEILWKRIIFLKYYSISAGNILEFLLEIL